MTLLEYEILERCILCDSKNILCLDQSNKIYVCKKCGHVFNNPRPHMESIHEFYSQEGKTNSWMGEKEQEKSWDNLSLRRLKKILTFKKSGRLLDVGCGTGRFINAARKVGFNVQGIEISESAIDIAKDLYGLDLLSGDLNSFDFGNEKFDIITLWHSLEHVPYPGRTLVKIKSILNVDGYIVIAVPNDDGYWFTRRFKNLFLSHRMIENKSFIEKKDVYNKWKIGDDSKEIHLSHFTPSILVDYLHSIDFKVKCVALDPYYVASGISLIKNFIYYTFCNTLNSLINVNLYDTILIIAQNRGN